MDSETFNRLYDDHAAGLLAFLTYQTGDRVLAEDIVADTFERVLTTRKGWRGRATEKTWIYAIAMNRARDLARRRSAESRALERAQPVEPAGEPMGGSDDRDLLRRAVQKLPPDERAIVALRFGADLTLNEIAELTGERRTTIEGRLYRGLRRLRDEAL